MIGSWKLPAVERIVIDKGYADLALIKPDEDKLSARILNSKTGVEKSYKVDKALFGYIDLIELSPGNLEAPITLKIKLYLVERFRQLNLTLLEMIL